MFVYSKFRNEVETCENNYLFFSNEKSSYLVRSFSHPLDFICPSLIWFHSKGRLKIHKFG